MVAAASPVAHGSGRAHPHGHAGLSTAYARRKPEAGVLYRVLQQHLATFLNDVMPPLTGLTDQQIDAVAGWISGCTAAP